MITLWAIPVIGCHATLTIRHLEKNLHRIQLNGYFHTRYIRWVAKRFSNNLQIRDVLPLAALLPLLVRESEFALGLSAAIYLLLFFVQKKTVEKKPLVFTPRAKRLFVTNIVFLLTGYVLLYLFLVRQVPVTSTSWLFFLLMLFALSLCSPVLMILSNLVVSPVEGLINRWYYNDARKVIGNFQGLRVIGITGSYGKTSTKHILTELLNSKLNTIMTPGSFNTPMGVCKVIRTDLGRAQQVFVVEMGARKRGDIKALAKLVLPGYGILTSIGDQHLETFKTRENVKRTKWELVDSLPADGMAFLNMDDKNIRDMAGTAKTKVIRYGVLSKDLDYRADNITTSWNGSAFEITGPSGETVAFTTRLLGVHNVYNILAAVAVGCEFGLPLSLLSNLVKGLMPVEHRLQLKRFGPGILLIDDAFNSNPVGARMALDVLKEMPSKRKILITPGMVELGHKEQEANEAFAEHAATVCDLIILVGKKQTLSMQQALNRLNFPKSKYMVTHTFHEAYGRLTEIAEEDDAILIENDLPDTYNES